MLDANTRDNTHYPSFDLIRTLLALEVVVVHVWVTFVSNLTWPGFISAVPAFLAVSGFLVLKSFAGSGSWFVFARKRALRIFPALISSFLLGYLLLGYEFFEHSLTVWITGGMYMPNPTNSALWSLAWEELAYAVLAIVWLFGGYRKPAVIWALFIVAYAGSLKVISMPINPYYHVLSFLAPSFFIGNLMYLHRSWLLRGGPLLPWLFLVVVCLWTHIPIPGVSGNVAPLPLQAFSVVWAGMAGKRLIPAKVPDISYGMYVYHIPLLFFLRERYLSENYYEFCILVAISVISFSLASWYLIEKPTLRFKQQRTSEQLANV